MRRHATKCPGLITLSVVLVLLCWSSAAAQKSAATQTLANFEDGKLGVFTATKGTVVDSKHLDGKALLLKSGENVAVWQPRIDWQSFNVLKFDVHNAADVPVRLHVCFKDDSAPHGYFSWINRYLSAKPGRSTMELFIPDLKRGEGSPKDMLDTRPFHWDKMQWLGISASGQLELDNFRLERTDVSLPGGVLAFDFGPPNQTVLPGMVGVSPDDAWNDGKGFGWSEKREIYTRSRCRAPDSFVQDWISGNRSTFSVKVPNGAYRVWLMWDDPGEWELVQHAAWRRIDVEGRTVLDEKMTGEQFLDFYFHFADTEDLPGDDIYKKYVEWRYRPKTFDVTVTDGRLDLTINGPDQYACTVNGVVIFPHAKLAEGVKYLEGLAKQRRDAFFKQWQEKRPKPQKLDAALEKKGLAAGCLVFRRPMSVDVSVYDVPKANEVVFPTELKSPKMPGVSAPGVQVGPTGVSVPGWSARVPGLGRVPGDVKVPEPVQPAKLAAARGEYEPTAFSVHALRDLPVLTVQAGVFRTKDGKTLPADALDVRVVRYKFKRIGFSGAGVYGVEPWILVDGRTTSVKKGMTRRFWVTVHVPADQPAGLYEGSITVAGATTFTLPVEVTVLPITLPDADMGLGMFGMGGTAPYFPYFEENRARNEADRVRSLACAREHGFTYYAIGRGMRFTGFDNAKAQYDVSAGQARVEEARRLGFTFLDLYGDAGIARQALNDKGPLAKKNGFDSPDALVKEVFGAAKRAAMQAGLPDPIWSFGDEPPDTQAPLFVAMHRRMRELADARSEISWSPHGEPTHELLDVTSICSLNVTDLEDIKRATDHGNVVYLNNQGRGRWAYGLYMWKARSAGARAFQQFCWMGTHADPYYPLDSYEDDGGHVYPDRQGNLRPKVDLERVREGIDDYRYTLALTHEIARAESGGARRETAKEAREYLHAVLGKLKFENTRRDRVPQMTDAELDAYRAKVQDYLVKLAQ
ncbi:MAG TPA: hypothetical protein VMY39_10805 [Planctomycetota bacterium]|nr:hypothetical protein [Planctomycetota bacterium]